MVAMRLRYVQMESDFRQSEQTHLLELRKRERRLVDGLKAKDVVAFVSRKQNQILFVQATRTVRDTARGTDVKVIASVRWRLPDGGTWHPLMLGNYARAVGIHLEGVRLFEEHYRELLDRADAEVKAVVTSVKRAA